MLKKETSTSIRHLPICLSLPKSEVQTGLLPKRFQGTLIFKSAAWLYRSFWLQLCQLAPTCSNWQDQLTLHFTVSIYIRMIIMLRDELAIDINLSAVCQGNPFFKKIKAALSIALMMHPIHSMSSELRKLSPC